MAVRRSLKPKMYFNGFESHFSNHKNKYSEVVLYVLHFIPNY